MDLDEITSFRRLISKINEQKHQLPKISNLASKEKTLFSQKPKENREIERLSKPKTVYNIGWM